MLVVHHALSCAGFILHYRACSLNGSVSFVWKPLCAFVLVLLDCWMEVTVFTSVTPVEESVTQRLYCTHQVLLAQSSELLELLGYQELGTSDSAANLPQHWRDNTNQQQHTHRHVSECTGICELLYDDFMFIQRFLVNQTVTDTAKPVYVTGAAKSETLPKFKKIHILCKLQTQCHRL